MSRTYPLSVFYLGSAQSERQLLKWRERTLACVTFANGFPQDEWLSAPVVQVNTPMIGAEEELLELWCAGQAVSSGRFGRGQYSFNSELLFGSVMLPESDFSERGNESDDGCVSPLQRATKHAFQDIFRLLDKLNYPHLLRIWNYFPAINVENYNLERYRQFNIGRQQAFVACGRSLTEDIPAACALGTVGEQLIIYFIAVQKKPIAIENPRQVSAYHYPADYGPSEPIFSRASLGRVGEQEVLFISGTASIIGHRSMHVGDVVAQTKEILVNIDAVVNEANCVAAKVHYDLESLSYKVYLRRQEDLNAVHNVLLQEIGSNVQVIYLEADICRQDLLVEIEAIAGIPLQTL